MKVLGITGGIGAGKSSVTRIFQDLGATVIDADVIAHKILEPDGRAYPAVVSAFGKEIVRPDKAIDRARLAQIVFGDSEKLERLNALTHPCVFAEMEAEIGRADTELVCLDVPLLFNCNFPISCDKTLAVLAPKELRIQRVMERDGCTCDQALARMKHQLSDGEFRQKADMILVNDGNVEKLTRQVEKIYHNMMEIK